MSIWGKISRQGNSPSKRPVGEYARPTKEGTVAGDEVPMEGLPGHDKDLAFYSE